MVGVQHCTESSCWCASEAPIGATDWDLGWWAVADGDVRRLSTSATADVRVYRPWFGSANGELGRNALHEVEALGASGIRSCMPEPGDAPLVVKLFTTSGACLSVRISCDASAASGGR